MNISLDTLISILPFAFAIHNLEEVFGMEKWTKSIPSRFHKPVTTKQFGAAVILLTILGFILVYKNRMYQNDFQYYLTISGFAGMLLLNVFFPHLLATIVLKKYAPGILTGIIFNLPLAILILIKIGKKNIMSNQQLFVAIILGGIIGVGLAYLFLKIGEVANAKI